MEYCGTPSSSSSSACSAEERESSTDTEESKVKPQNFEAAKKEKKLKELGYVPCMNECGASYFKTSEEASQHRKACPKELRHLDYSRQYQHCEGHPLNPEVKYERGATRASAKNPRVGFLYNGRTPGAMLIRKMK